MNKTKVYTFNPPFLPKALEEFEKDQVKYLKQIKSLEPGLKIGDIVQLKPYLQGRNSGKFIYDGNDIIAFSFEFDDYGHLPLLSQFEVVRHFPIKYWSESVETNIVYFNCKQMDIKIKQIYQYQNTFYYLFTGLDGKLYGIFESKDNSMPAENKQEFLDRIMNADYFIFTDNKDQVIGEYLGEGQLDFDHILLVV